MNENATIGLTTAEQHLSHKLSQLSAAGQQQQVDEQPNRPKESTVATTTEKKRPPLTPSTPIPATKKSKPDIIDLSSGGGDDFMPRYLSNSNQTFEDIINPTLQKSANTVNIEDLRQIALLEHKLKLVDLNTSLWTTYLRSGTSKLNEDEQHPLQAAAAGITTSLVRSNLSIWPEELKSTMLADRNENFKANEIDYDKCLNYVMKMLRSFREQNNYYQLRLKERKQRLNNCFTLEIGEVINSFVEEYGIRSHRLQIESKIAAIKYDYKDRLSEFDFHQQNPYQDQIATFKNLTQRKLVYEKSKMETNLLRQCIAHHQLTSIFNSIQIPSPRLLNTIEDRNIRQSLIYRYEQLVQRTKSEMTTIHVRAADVKMEEDANKFHTDFQQYNQTQRTGPIDKKFTKTMDDIMQQRFKNIEERLEKLYNIKLHFFVKAPTVAKN